MASKELIRTFKFTDITGALEVTDDEHPHREPQTLFVDEFALDKLYSIDFDFYEKNLEAWAQRFYSHEKHMNCILKYGFPDLKEEEIDVNSWNHALEATRTELRKLGRVTSLNLITELDQVPYESTESAGFNYDGKKGPFRGDNHMEAIRQAMATVAHVIDHPEGMERTIETMIPDIGYTRKQLAYVPEKKVKGAWGRAFHYILIEGLSAGPLIEALKSTDTFFFVGRDPVVGVPKTINTAKEKGDWLFTLDWSSFEATVSTVEINTAFDLLKEVLLFPNWDSEVAFEISRQLFIHKKIAAPDGKVYWSHKGAPTGSYYTKIIDSVVNRLRCEYMWHQLVGRSPAFLVTQGDDALGSDEMLFDVERAAEIAFPLGWILNPNKVEVTRSALVVEFLGRTESGHISTREFVRCVRLLVFPEEAVDSGQISARRARSIAEDVGGLNFVLTRVADKLEDKYVYLTERSSNFPF